MNSNHLRFLFVIVVFCFNISLSQTIQQRLLVVDNDMVNGGNFKVAVQVKGTDLTVANTLGSATIDIQYDDKINYVNATNFAFGGANGYSFSVTPNTGFVRIGITSFVNDNCDAEPDGFDVGPSYSTWVQLNFTIASEGLTSLSIESVSNAVGLYNSHANQNCSGTIADQTLSTPISIVDEPTPVELTTFTASVKNNVVNLNWQTATEVNNYGFDVERSVRGHRSEVNGQWEKIGFVKGSGNSNSPKYYSFTDKRLNGGTKFKYRLKQIDTDGKFEYSDEVEVEVVPEQYSLSQNYPNPFNPITSIKFELPQAARVTLNVYNILGEQVVSLVNENLEAGFHSVPFNASALPSGTYIYRLQAGSGSGKGFVQTKKMILLK